MFIWRGISLVIWSEILIVLYLLIVKSFALNNLVPFPQVLTNKFQTERNLKTGAQ